MKMTDRASIFLKTLLAENPDKIVRIIFQGFG